MQTGTARVSGTATTIIPVLEAATRNLPSLHKTLRLQDTQDMRQLQAMLQPAQMRL